ncbi:unnamed protein product [Miscanthus lutarioriparius]|uniref:Glutamyl-tRNA synthetase n=1 Tax=Miscanthus lutarioriparius TaxID=422564 RepID=A0A811P7J2_9POAL|nr:unnamed protein product [Miscanthus lutarioriparius]
MDAALAFARDSPPLSIIAAAKIASVPLTIDPSLASGSAPTLYLGSVDFIHGISTILRYIARVAIVPNFYGQDAIQAAHIDQWLEYAPVIPSSSEFEAACSFLDGYLASRTFLVGHSQIADIVVWSNIAGTGQRWESLRRSTKYQNLTRWFNCIAVDYASTLDDVIVAYVGKRGIGKSPAPSLKENIHDPTENTPGPEIDLPGAKIGEVCLRFAPEPSGYLIGHAKAGLLNKYFADRYKGRLIVRFDDTNPLKESNEFVENVLRDIDTMGIKYDTVTYTSDYFPKLTEMAESLIMQGKAYVDDTPRTQMEVERRAGVESTCRNNIVEENLSLWREMVNGTESGMQCCLRGKLDIQDPNKSLHDPVYYRCNTDPHHRVGSTYKAYPTYDFACPFVDALQGVTHALRSSEYHDRNAQYYRILQDMGLQRNKKVDDWTDPRFPTIQGMGASKNLNLMEGDKLWTINKKMIDPVCARHTALLKDQHVLFSLTNGPEEPFIRILPRHKKYEGAGNKNTTFTNRIWLEYADASVITTGQEVTLMDWGNAVIKEIKTENGIITQLLEEKDDFVNHLNPCTRRETSALGDPDTRNLKQGEIIQLERKGYYRCDVPFTGPSQPIVLFAIPDGRQQSPAN